MTLVDNTSIRHCRLAAIAAAVIISVLAVAGSVARRAAAQPAAFPSGMPASSPTGVLTREQNEGADSDGNNTTPVITEAHGFLLDQGEFTMIDVPGAARTGAGGINDWGQIVGTYDDAEGTTHGFLLDQGKFTTIDVPGASGTDAFGLSGTAPARINNRGQIVGLYLDADGIAHGFLLDQGVFTPIDPPGGLPFPATVDINDRGQIVGFTYDIDLNGEK